jgi:flavin-binding protein dodecin
VLYRNDWEGLGQFTIRTTSPPGRLRSGGGQTHASQTSAVEAPEGNIMSVYRVTELIGTSELSWEEAAVTALNRASNTLRDLRVAEVVKQDVQINDGKVTYRIKLQVSFKYEGEGTDSPTTGIG